MCKCAPEIRTPFCGKLGCEWPKKDNIRSNENLRDELLEELKEASKGNCMIPEGFIVTTPERLADFILERDRKIVDPLVECEKEIFENMWGGEGANLKRKHAARETLKLAGVKYA